MSLFPSSSGIIINGGTFTSISLPTQDAGQFLFPFQALLLTVLITAGPTQVLGKRKDHDSDESDDYDDLRKRRRCRSLETLDGLTVCLQATMLILFHDQAFVIDHKQRRIRSEQGAYQRHRLSHTLCFSSRRLSSG